MHGKQCNLMETLPGSIISWWFQRWCRDLNLIAWCTLWPRFGLFCARQTGSGPLLAARCRQKRRNGQLLDMKPSSNLHGGGGLGGGDIKGDGQATYYQLSVQRWSLRNKVVLIKLLHFAQDLYYTTLISLASQQSFPMKACVNLPAFVFKS